MKDRCLIRGLRKWPVVSASMKVRVKVIYCGRFYLWISSRNSMSAKITSANKLKK